MTDQAIAIARLGEWVEQSSASQTERASFVEVDADNPNRVRLAHRRPSNCPVCEWQAVQLLRAVHSRGEIPLPAAKHPQRDAAVATAQQHCAVLNKLLTIDLDRGVVLLNPQHHILATMLKRLGTVAKSAALEGACELTLTELGASYQACFPDGLPVTSGTIAVLPLVTELAVLPIDASFQTVSVVPAATTAAIACLTRLTRLALQHHGTAVDAQVQLDLIGREQGLPERHGLSVQWLHRLQPVRAPLLAFSRDYRWVRSVNSTALVVAHVCELLRSRGASGCSRSELAQLVPTPGVLLKPALERSVVVARVDKDTDVRYYWLGTPPISSTALHRDTQLDTAWKQQHALESHRYPRKAVRDRLLAHRIDVLDALAWNRQTGQRALQCPTLNSMTDSMTTSIPRVGPSLQTKQQKRRQTLKTQRQRAWMRSALRKTSS